ncbi:CoA ester lyase [Dactylosporangium maewongense]|uniref:CoA ester lyase n=1 Tax=Dactylosporangium maewongense TaxID=634393 RepID=A0ABN1ZPX2_9ACTN
MTGAAIADRIARATGVLFVPGGRPERFDRAAGTGAPVVIDLEDAVAPQDKATARSAALAWLAAGNPAAVRINAIGTEWHADDVAALSTVDAAVMLPKAEDPSAIEDLTGRLGSTPAVIALVETAAGVLDAARIARVPGVARLAFGHLDLAAQLGVDPADRSALATCRHTLVLASAAAGLPGPIDGVTTDLSDDALLADDVTYARGLGFTGKLCIHPRQVPLVRAAFRPSADETAWATRIVAAAAAGGAVVTVDGRMVDRPVVERARRVLERGEAGD